MTTIRVREHALPWNQSRWLCEKYTTQDGTVREIRLLALFHTQLEAERYADENLALAVGVGR